MSLTELKTLRGKQIILDTVLYPFPTMFSKSPSSGSFSLEIDCIFPLFLLASTIRDLLEQACLTESMLNHLPVSRTFFFFLFLGGSEICSIICWFLELFFEFLGGGDIFISVFFYYMLSFCFELVGNSSN